MKTSGVDGGRPPEWLWRGGGCPTWSFEEKNSKKKLRREEREEDHLKLIKTVTGQVENAVCGYHLIFWGGGAIGRGRGGTPSPPTPKKQLNSSFKLLQINQIASFYFSTTIIPFLTNLVGSHKKPRHTLHTLLMLIKIPKGSTTTLKKDSSSSDQRRYNIFRKEGEGKPPLFAT